MSSTRTFITLQTPTFDTIGPGLAGVHATDCVGRPRQDAPQRSCLIVDDDPDLAGLLSFHLTRYGFAPTVCRTLQEARHLLGSARWDLVVIDVLLPDGDGRALIERVRDLRTAARVVLTSVLTRYDLPFHDADAYLGKPFRSADVDRVLTIAGFAHPDLAY